MKYKLEKIKQYNLIKSETSIKKLIDKRQPFKFKYRNKLLQSSILYTLLDHQQAQNLDIQISASSQFSGHYQEQAIKIMSLDQFINYDGKLNLYLAQVPIYQKKRKSDLIFAEQQSVEQLLLDQQNQEQFQKLIEKGLIIPKQIKFIKETLHSVNIWCSKGKTLSKWHYDSHDNFMILEKGKKIFYLLPPNTQQLNFPSLLTPSYNQASQLDKIQNCFKIELKAGEIIHIPQGWLHQVKSFSHCEAINFWYNSILDNINTKENFYFRYLINELSSKQLLKDIQFQNLEFQQNFNQQDFKQINEFIENKQYQKIFEGPIYRTAYTLGLKNKLDLAISLLFKYHPTCLVNFLLIFFGINKDLVKDYLSNLNEILTLSIVSKLDEISEKESLIYDIKSLKDEFFEKLWNIVDSSLFDSWMKLKEEKLKKSLNNLLLEFKC